MPSGLDLVALLDGMSTILSADLEVDVRLPRASDNSPGDTRLLEGVTKASYVSGAFLIYYTLVYLALYSLI